MAFSRKLLIEGILHLGGDIPLDNAQIEHRFRCAVRHSQVMIGAQIRNFSWIQEAPDEVAQCNALPR